MHKLQIKHTGLTARAYTFSREVRRDFWFPSYYDETRTDLCTLVRSIFVIMPLAYLINALTVAYAAWMLWMFFSLLWLYLTVTAIVVGAILAAVGFGLCVWVMFRFGRQIGKTLEKSEAVRAVNTYYRAKKEKICPLVEIEP